MLNPPNGTENEVRDQDEVRRSFDFSHAVWEFCLRSVGDFVHNGFLMTVGEVMPVFEVH